MLRPTIPDRNADLVRNYHAAMAVTPQPEHDAATGAVVPPPIADLAPRLVLTRYLVGAGIEMGPGHHPMALPFGGADVRYVDRWDPGQNRDLFPELGDAAPFPKPDIVANLDTDKLAMLDDASQDFVIASHLLEHMADPLGQLAEIHRVLVPGGTLLLLLPDRRHSFDSTRPPTTLQHLVDDHRVGMTAVSDDHIEEFLRHTGSWNDEWDRDVDGVERKALFDLHRQRSIHVHCWTEHEFLPVIEHAQAEMGVCWDLLDALFVEDVAESFEFGFVLRRAPERAQVPDPAGRLRATYGALWRRSCQARGAASTVTESSSAPARAPGHRRRWRRTP
jgi:SAM-dependent methyltransferase